MPTVSLPSIECLASGIYVQPLTTPSRAAVEKFLNIIDQLMSHHSLQKPLYVLLDASSLDIAYTPRVREHLEAVIARLYSHHRIVRVAFVLPHTMSSCAVFLNNLLRCRETSQGRHTCFARYDQALLWLENLQRGESAAAVSGL